MEELSDLIAEKLKISAKNKKKWRLYTKAGLQLFDSDIVYLKDQDLLFLALNGQQFSFDVIFDEYQIKNKLGEGGFGSVVRAVHKQTGANKAIKFINIHQYMHSANMIDQIYREADALKKMKHLNIIQLQQAFVYKGQFVLVIQYASGGELLSYVLEKGCLQQEEAHQIFQQIMSALRYCHGRGTVHRDLKLQNILFKDSSKAQIKIVDFGIAGSKKESSDAGSILYMPPEIVSGADTSGNPAIDIWALGIMLYSMIYGQMPFDGKSMDQISKKIEQTEPNYPVKQNKMKNIQQKHPVTPECRDLIKKLLKKQVEERITLNQIFIHSWMQFEEQDFVNFRENYQQQAKKKSDMKAQEEQKQVRSHTGGKKDHMAKYQSFKYESAKPYTSSKHKPQVSIKSAYQSTSTTNSGATTGFTKSPSGTSGIKSISKNSQKHGSGYLLGASSSSKKALQSIGPSPRAKKSSSQIKMPLSPKHIEKKSIK